MSKKTFTFAILAVLCLSGALVAHVEITKKVERSRILTLVPAPSDSVQNTEITFMSDDNYIMIQH